MGLIFLGALIEVGFIALAFVADWREHLVLVSFIYAAQFAGMLLAWRRGVPARVLWAFAVLFRITLWPILPSLSDDLYRYGWEARVQRAGWSPYEYPPSSPELAFLHDASYPLINHKDVPTLYPPLTQLAFRMGHHGQDFLERLGVPSLRANAAGQKGVFIFFDLLCLAAILALVRRRAGAPTRAVLYAWNPLVIMEVAGSGHHDSVGIFYMLAGLLVWDQGRFLLSAAGLAAAFLSKYVTVLLAPFLLWKKRWRELGLWAALAAVAMLPFCLGSEMARGASSYAAHWQFNGSLYPLLAAALGRPAWAKWIVAAGVGGLALVLGKRESDLSRLAFLMIAAALLAAPTVHPWYFIWLIPLLCLFPHPAFLIWNATIFLSYSVWPRYARGEVWDLHPLVQILEYAPVYGYFAWAYFRPLSGRLLL